VTITPWKIASVVVLLLAVGYWASRQPPKGPTFEQRMEKHEASTQSERTEAVDLLNRINSANSRMQDSSADFGSAIQDALDAENRKPQPVRETHAATLQLIRKLQSEWADATPPSSDIGAKLSDEYIEYLKWQEQIYANDYADIIDTIENKETADSERYNMVHAVLHEQSAAEEPKNKRLVQLQNELRRKYRIE
jgi:hypothetical protein